MITISAYQMALKFSGIKEIQGAATNPQISTFLMLDHSSLQSVSDETPWCSAFVNYIAWLCGLPRSKSWAARSWLEAGRAISLDDAVADSDIVILKRGTGTQPGPEVLQAPGHVGFYAGRDADGNVLLLGGNQGDQVSIKPFSISNILGVRRLENA